MFWDFDFLTSACELCNPVGCVAIVFFYTHTVKIPLKIPKLTRTKTYGLFAMHNRREMRCTEQSKRNIRSAELKTLTAVELY